MEGRLDMVRLNMATTRHYHCIVPMLLIALLAGGAIVTERARSEDAGLQPLKYNHPGLTVDLGVGLWAWPLPMDIDGDGDLDLVVNCPDKPHNGVYVFENAHGATTREPMPTFRPGRRLSRGLQNVQISYPAEGPRILTPGQHYPDFLTTGLERPEPFALAANIHPNPVRANMWRVVDFDGDGRDDLIVGVGDWTDYGWDNAYDAEGNWLRGPLRGFIYWVRNEGTRENPKYAMPEKVVAGDRPAEVFGWPSPNFADFDGDGDLDLLCGEFLDGFTYFENVGTRTQPEYAEGRRLHTADGNPLGMDLQMITPTAIDWDHDGDLDLIVGDEDGRVAWIENSGCLRDDRTPLFLPPRYFQQEADHVKCGALATPVGVDWDGDGDIDIISGNTAGYIVFFENLSGPGVEEPKWGAPRYLQAAGEVIRIQAGPHGSIQGPAEAKWGYTTLSVADWDGDGLHDLIVNSIWGQVVWYRNIGAQTKPELAASQPIEVEWEGAPPELAYGWLRPHGKELLTQWRTTPVAIDWNRDGLVDLIMLDHEGYLAFFERVEKEGERILLPPRRAFHGLNLSVTDSRHGVVDASPGPLQLNQGIAGRSGRRKLCIVDWDGDGKLDILVNSSSANLLRQVDEREGNWYFEDTGPLVSQSIEGHTTSPTVVDFDGNGIPDYLGGAEDGRFYYFRNSRQR
jgi:hypothetical protein